MSFGEKLSNLRKSKGLSQEDLASELNVSRQAVSKWESNNAYPETEKILAICKLFDVSMDELMGLKVVKTEKKNNKLINIINSWCDNFLKSIRLFINFNFKTKILCLLEMAIYLVIIIFLIFIFHAIFNEVLESILYILPYDIKDTIFSMFQGVLLAFYFIITLVLLIKLYKVRYLDCYDYYKEKEDTKDTFNDNIKEVNNQKEKIIIRDVKSFNPFHYIYKALIIFMKAICLVLSLFVAFIFVLLCTMLMFDIYFIYYGLLLVYFALILLSLIIICYIILEIIVKLVFSLTIKSKKLYIMFITSLIVLGISIGLSICEITTYRIEEREYNYKMSEVNINMKNNLVMAQIFYNDNVEVIFEDRSDILVELYGSEKMDGNLDVYDIDESNYIHTHYHIYNLYTDSNNISAVVNDFLNQIKNKTLLTDMDKWYQIKVHISKDNYNKLNENLINYNKLYEE